MQDRFGSFVMGITACYKYIQRIKAAEMVDFGLKGTHVMCLFYLHRHPEGLTAAQLCQLCDEDKGAISRSITELESGSYLSVQRTDGKNYRARICLTEKGITAAQQMESLIGNWVEAVGGNLTQQERETFYLVLEKIAGNLKAEFVKEKETP